MRSLAPVHVALVVVSIFVSTFLWRELKVEQRALEAERQSLQEERQLTDQLRTQLAVARAERVSSLTPQSATVQSATKVVPQSASNVAAPSQVVSLLADAVKKQKTLLDNSEYHKARVAELRVTLKGHNPLLARELGISEREADAIFDVLAEDQLREDGLTLDLISANGSQPDAAAMEEMKRLQQAQQQERETTLLSMLGPAKYEQLQYIEETQFARTRIVNLKTLLAQSGQPLTIDQELSLTKVMAAEQKREEKESQELRISGQVTQASQLDRAVEGDRRILDGATGFLSAQQLETIRVRFEQRQGMERASGVVTTRERAAAQVSPN